MTIFEVANLIAVMLILMIVIALLAMKIFNKNIKENLVR